MTAITSPDQPLDPAEPVWLELVRCSFCGKQPTDPRQVVLGPTPKVAICRECVTLCNEIITELLAPSAGGPPPAA